MDKKKYYVSVQARSILEEQGAASYELEIEANPEQIERLQDLFDWKSGAEKDTFVKSITPGVQYHIDPENDSYDASLQQIYQLLHELGTADTREHIESMGVLE